MPTLAPFCNKSVKNFQLPFIRRSLWDLLHPINNTAVCTLDMVLIPIPSPNPCHFFPAQPILAIQQFVKRSLLKALLNFCETFEPFCYNCIRAGCNAKFGILFKPPNSW